MKTAAAIAVGGMVLGSLFAGAEAEQNSGTRSSVSQAASQGDLSLPETPEAVQKAIRKNMGSARIVDIDKGSIGNRVVYQVTFERDQSRSAMVIAADGELLSSKSAEDAPAIGSSVGARLEALPYDVQNSVRNTLGDAKIVLPDQPYSGEQTAYRIAFEQNGKRSVAVYARDGRILQFNNEKAREVDWQSIPEPVEEVLRREGGRRSILSATADQRGGQTIYSARVVRGGNVQELLISPDGRLLKRNPADVTRGDSDGGNE